MEVWRLPTGTRRRWCRRSQRRLSAARRASRRRLLQPNAQDVHLVSRRIPFDQLHSMFDQIIQDAESVTNTTGAAGKLTMGVLPLPGDSAGSETKYARDTRVTGPRRRGQPSTHRCASLRARRRLRRRGRTHESDRPKRSAAGPATFRTRTLQPIDRVPGKTCDGYSRLTCHSASATAINVSTSDFISRPRFQLPR
jgi:hypothetical protein